MPLRVLGEPTEAFTALNVLCLCWIAIASYVWLSRRLRRPAIAVPTVLLIIVAYPVRCVVGAGYSEPLFTALALGAIVLLDPTDGTPATWRRLWGACALTALSCLTRYTGVAVVATGCMLILAAPGRQDAKRVGRAAAFAAVALLPISLWCLRNHALTGTMIGDRDASHLTLSQNLGFALDVLGQWFGCRAALLAVSALALCATVRFRRPAILAPCGYALVYALLMLGAACRVDMDPIDTRLLFPAFPPLVWVLAILVDAAADSAHLRRLALAPLGTLCAAWCWYGLTARAPDYGYNGPPWRAADLASAAVATPPHARLYSNDAAACYLVAQRRAAWLPAEGEPRTTATAIEDLEDLQAPAYYLWFDRTLTDGDIDIARLAVRLRLRTAVRRDHWTLFEVPPPEQE